MDFFDSPGFMYFCAIMLVIGINVIPYYVSAYDSRLWKICVTLFASIIFVIGYLVVLWPMTNEFFVLSVIIFTISYVHFCFTIKRQVSLKFYTTIFIIVSLFFVLWTTAMFGKYYVENNLIDFSNYIAQYTSIIEAHDLVPIMDFKLSVIFFNVSFERYFILPDDISFINPFFIQFIFGIIVSGTIISWAIDVIKYFVTPSKSN